MVAPWTPRLSLALISLLALSGCREETTVDPPLPLCSNEPAPIPSSAFPQPAVMRVGQRASLQIFPLPSSRCGEAANTRPTSVTAEVEGPEGQVIPSRIELGLAGSSATLEFTPERQGPHHILVAFSEVGGLHQFDVHAALDRTAEAPPQTLARPCRTLERTLQGAWVCAPEVLRGDTSLGVFPGARMAVAGDVVWVVRDSRVERYVDTGTELRLTGSTTHTRGAAEFLLAAPDELAVLYGSSLTRYAFQDGVLEATGSLPWSRPSLPISLMNTPYGVLLREGDHLVVGTRVNSGIASVIQLCSHQLISGTFQRTQESCRTIPGEIVGFEPTVLWTKEFATPNVDLQSKGLLRRWEWSSGQLVEQGSMALGSHAIVLDPTNEGPANVPLIGNVTSSSSIPPMLAVVTWVPRQRALLLEYLDPAVTEVHASPSFYWTVQPTATSQPTRVRLRPPPP